MLSRVRGIRKTRLVTKKLVSRIFVEKLHFILIFGLLKMSTIFHLFIHFSIQPRNGNFGDF